MQTKNATGPELLICLLLSVIRPQLTDIMPSRSRNQFPTLIALKE
jgi:hypothetical protein